METRKDNLYSIKETLQPFIVCCNSLYYVIINSHKYKLHSLEKAIDTCFKMFFALDLSYPIECKQVSGFVTASLISSCLTENKSWYILQIFLVKDGQANKVCEKNNLQLVTHFYSYNKFLVSKNYFCIMFSPPYNF